MLISQKKGFYEFVSTILPQSLFNTLMDLLYSAFVSKLFISNDSLILRLCMLDNFASVFWVQPIKPPMTIFRMFSCTQWSPFSIHAIFLVFNRSSECTFFCFSNVSPPPVKITLHPVFQSSFLILGPIIGILGSLTMLLSVFSDFGP